MQGNVTIGFGHLDSREAFSRGNVVEKEKGDRRAGSREAERERKRQTARLQDCQTARRCPVSSKAGSGKDKSREGADDR